METNGNTVEVTYWRSAKIPTVQYGSRDICLTMKQECPPESSTMVYEALKHFVDERVEAQANAITNVLSDNDYRLKDGKKYVRVSKVLSPDPIQIPNIERYALRGTAIHGLVITYLETGTWANPTDDISPLKWTDIKYKEFFEKFGDKFGKHDLNIELYNEKHLYSGEADFLGEFEGKRTLGDFKTGTWKLEQLVAYKNCGLNPIEQLAIFDLKKCEAITWDVNDPEVLEAWMKFREQRAVFKYRFGI